MKNYCGNVSSQWSVVRRQLQLLTITNTDSYKMTNDKNDQ